MTLNKALAAFSLLLFASTSAFAGIEKDDKTVSIFGSFTSTDDADTITISAAGGYFLTDVLEVQGVILLSSTSSSSFDSTVTGYGLNANLYLPQQNPDFIPYVGGGATVVVIDNDFASDTEFGLNAQAGIKQFLSEQISINYQAQLVSAGDYDATILSVGFSIFLE